MARRFPLPLLLLFITGMTTAASAEEPLHDRIDKLILAGAGPADVSPLAEDAEFLRRVSLDLGGKIPSAKEVREFLADGSPDKRARKIEQLLAAPAYATRMQQLFHVMLMERLGDHDEWTRYLQASFEANKPWDAMVREMLRADPANEKARGAAFFYAKRLENYGQNPVDYPGLTRDVGRLFLGKDLRCAECHDHLFVAEYKQADFQGLFAFFQNTFLADPKTFVVGEKPTTAKLAFMSVFTKVPLETAPRLPGGEEITIPVLKKGEEYVVPPDRKAKTPGVLRFSPLEQLAKELPTPDNRDFSRNIVNRLWFVMMGRGIVHPLDLHHDGNPPSHPELLDLLADEFVAHKFDIKWMLGQLALTKTYQRTSMLPPGKDRADPARFLTMIEKRLSSEQLLASVIEATGAGAKPETVQAAFVQAFANPAREPEEEVNPSLKGALFLLNDPTVLGWLEPKSGNLTDRLGKISDSNKIAEELYLSVLSRMPVDEEKAMVSSYLQKNADRRAEALRHLTWALLASTEFSVNH